MPDPRPTPFPASIERSSVPRHVAIVMDGSGRWAQRQGLPRTEGHGAGEVSLVDTTYGALAAGVKALTVFAFSTENWRRPVDEVRYLMNFNRGLLERRQHELNADGVRIVFSGRRDWRVPRIRERLYHPELPDLDLVVRTSGEYRISNFLLWEMAYSELIFTEVLWPDFRREDLYQAIEEYQRRERRFGGVDQ